MSHATPRSASVVGGEAPHGGSILKATGIHRDFRMGESTVAVLKGVDLSLRAGEFVAIEGRSGSGKSTLMHIMGALDEANTGVIHFDGKDIAAMSAAERSKLRN